MKRPSYLRHLLAGIFAALVAAPAVADGFGYYGGKVFDRVGTFANYTNNADIEDATVSEIIAATADGKTLVYTDSENGQIGFVDISDPSRPLPAGTVKVSGDPTSVAVLGDQYALVATSTGSLAEPNGNLDVVDIATRTVVREVALAGQPDSVAIGPDQRYAAIAIENERDEDLCVGGDQDGLEIVDEDDFDPIEEIGKLTTEDLCQDGDVGLGISGGGVAGGLPQLPAGFLAIVDLVGGVDAWSVRTANLSGLSAYAPNDPEPEFVDIDERNLAVVTLQENNHIVTVDLASGAVVRDFDAGAVTLNGVDATEDGVISLTETLTDVVREPDAVAWIPGPGRLSLIATANEGDLFGGSRNFTLFRENGSVAFDAGTSYEELAVRYGHYPEGRSDSKGSEPEAIAYGRFGRHDYIFVGSERGSFIAVYQLIRGRPFFVQLLPGPLGPEGLLAIPSRNLLAVSGEEDDPPRGVRSTIMLYELQRGAPTYPQLLSADNAPFPWSAMSGMVAVPGPRERLLAVWDSFYSTSKIFTIDANAKPARVIDEITIQGGTGNYDPEGIAIAPDGTFWIASEGNGSGSRPNRLLQTDPNGSVLAEVRLPAEIDACRAASDNRGSLGSGFEGVAVLPAGRAYKLLIAQQRGWDYTTPECEHLDDDPKGMNQGEPPLTRIWIYDPAADLWDFIPWELAPVPQDADWSGLSEITSTKRGLVLIERDNLTGDFAKLKTLVKVSLRDAADGVTADEKAVYDLIPDFLKTNGWITDKPEGVAITRDGKVFVVSDNDGVDGWSGESWFLRLGEVDDLFDKDDDDDDHDDDDGDDDDDD